MVMVTDTAYAGYFPDTEEKIPRAAGTGENNCPTIDMPAIHFLEAYGSTLKKFLFFKNKRFSFRWFRNGKATEKKFILKPSRTQHSMRVLPVSECFVTAGIIYNKKGKATYEFFIIYGDLMGLFICKAGADKPQTATRWINDVYSSAM